MRVLISGAAGCVAYLDGGNLYVLHIADPEGWKTIARSELRHVFLQASDVTEIEVADREQAEEVATRKANVTHALRLLELVMSTDLPAVASRAASYLEEWLADTNVRTEMQKYCFAIRTPQGINMRRVLFRTNQPRTRALLQEIAEAQTRIEKVNGLLDRSLPRVARRPEEPKLLKSAFIASGAFQALVRGDPIPPEQLLVDRYARLIPLFRRAQLELWPSIANDDEPRRGNIWDFAGVSLRWLFLLATVAAFIVYWGPIPVTSDVRFEDIRMIVSAILALIASIAAFAMISRDK